MTKEELSKLPENELLEWFFINAKYNKMLYSDGGYQLRVGTKILHAKDTDILLEKLEKFIKD